MQDRLDSLRGFYGETLKIAGPKEQTSMIRHLGLNASVKLKYQNSPKYRGGSRSPLSDGIINNVSPRWAFYYDKWLGFEVDDLDATLDLKSKKTINAIKVRFLEKMDSWIFPPKAVNISVSDNGKDFKKLSVNSVRERAEGGIAYINIFSALNKNRPVRYIRVIARNVATCPDWHPGAGGKAWLFVDEIIVE
jgi:hexosaminidase